MPGTGTLEYTHPEKPYAVTKLAFTGSGIDTKRQSIDYTSFQRPKYLFNEPMLATFIYNASGERVKMLVSPKGANVPSMYQFHYENTYISNYEHHSNGGREILYLGGDAYSAPAVYVKQYSGDWKIYYICRDYLGSITHIANADGSLKEENSYNAWGRLRSPETHELRPQEGWNMLFLSRGYTGHEQLDVFGLINMNARLYDPAIGRFLSPDPYVQAPWMTQNFNRYSYALNNPLVYVDEDGEFIFTLLSAIFCPALLPMAIQTDIGWITGGISAASNGGSFWEGALKGGLIGAANGALSMISPVKIPFGQSGFGLTIAPQIAVGTDGMGFGLNATFGYDLGKGFTAGVNFGGTYYASATGTGASGFEGRLGYGIGYQGKHFQAGIGSTYFFSGETSQQTGQMYAGGGKWRLTYENDTWAPVPGLLKPGGAERDKFRTAALRFDITSGKLKGANAGFNIFTGKSNGSVDWSQGPNGTFNETGNRYRFGAVYVGYGNYRVGYNSEKNVRAPIQNGFHDLMRYPHFEVLNIRSRLYGGYYSLNPYTLW